MGLAYETLMVGSIPSGRVKESPAEQRGMVDWPRKLPSRVRPAVPLRRVILLELRSRALRKAEALSLGIRMWEKIMDLKSTRAILCLVVVDVGESVFKVGTS